MFADRPGHDRRYSLSSEKVRALGWTPAVRFTDGLERTVAWYRENPCGGSRSAQATIASTTNASTAARSADPRPPGSAFVMVPSRRRPRGSAGHCTPEIFHFPPSFTSTSVLGRVLPWRMLVTLAVPVCCPAVSLTWTDFTLTTKLSTSAI